MMPVKVRLKELQVEYFLKHGTRPTYNDIADATGLYHATVGSLARQETRRIDFATIEALCRFFNCSVGELLQIVDGQGQADE